ncbi:MAG: molybdenum ABC transporter ATP-binding protein [Chloroflexi bacterium]|nr:molybdenum ABC transporter ATP-binding protein [Chloroflexota bacterium]
MLNTVAEPGNNRPDKNGVLQFSFTRTQGRFVLEVDGNFGPGITALFGPSGSGKTTLLNCLAGLFRPDSGEIVLNGRDLYRGSTKTFVPPERRRIGLVFQDGALFPHLSVAGNIRYGWRRTPESDRRVDVDHVVELLRLGPLMDRSPSSLSGGEKQRVALARALAMSPGLLLLDEPMASLDARLRGVVLSYLRRIHKDLHIPMVYVSHSISEVLALADDALVISDGKPVASGRPSRVLLDPAVDGIVQDDAIENLLDGTVTEPGSESAAGRVRVGAADIVAAYVQDQPGMTNASVELDPRTLAPTYRLTVGLPGRSYALTIAGRMGIDPQTLERAHSLLSAEHRQAEELLRQLEEERYLAEQQRKAAQEELAQVQETRQDLEEKLRELEEQKNLILEEARRQLQVQADELWKRLQRAERALTRPETRPQLKDQRADVARVRNELRSALWQPPQSAASGWIGELKPGDYVYVRGIPNPVEVLSPPDNSNAIEILLGSIRARLPSYQLEKKAQAPPLRLPEGVTVSRAPSGPTSTELDIIGLRVEEAEGRLEVFLDQAVLGGLSAIRVIHGGGTGALRAMVRERLKGHPLVKTARPEKSGITDGVTTCFAMHGNVLDVEGYARRFEASGALVNYGAAVRDRLLRTKSGAADRYKPASPKQIETMKNLADRAIKEGAVGIGFGINYVPGASYEEIFALFETAAKNNVSCHLHARYKGNIFPGTMSLAVQEVIDQQRQRWYVE